MLKQMPSSLSPARQHDINRSTASTRRVAAAVHPAARTDAQAREAALDQSRGPNPLWAINVGLAAFLAIIALIMMFD